MDKWLLEAVFVLGGLTLATFQWLIKKWVENLEKNLGELQANQKDIDKEVKLIKETYAPRSDIKEIKDEIIDRLARIEGYLMRGKDV